MGVVLERSTEYQNINSLKQRLVFVCVYRDDDRYVPICER